MECMVLVLPVTGTVAQYGGTLALPPPLDAVTACLLHGSTCKRTSWPAPPYRESWSRGVKLWW